MGNLVKLLIGLAALAFLIAVASGLAGTTIGE